MRRIGQLGIGLLAVGVLYVSVRAAEVAPVPDGMGVFNKYRCRTCHSVQSLGLEKKKAATEESDTGVKGKKEPPDLSGVGLKQKPEWIAKFMLKKETLDGEKHSKLFKGTPAELDTLSRWLGSLQTKPEKKGGKK